MCQYNPKEAAAPQSDSGEGLHNHRYSLHNQVFLKRRMKFNSGIIVFLFSGLICAVPLGEIQASDKEEFIKMCLNGFIDVEGADTQE